MRMVLVPGFSQPASSWGAVVAAPPLAGAAPRIDPVAVEVPDGLDFDATAVAIGDAARRGIYVGYSMGGRLALALALARPELVDGLVLVSATPGIADDAQRAARARADAALAAEIDDLGVAGFLDRWLAQPLFATLSAERAGRDERVATNTPARLAHQLTRLGQGAMRPRWGELASLAMPVLLVTGTLDPAYRAVAVAMAARIAGARHEELAGGHALVGEAPEALAEILARFAHDVRASGGRTE